jgi:hypothetical protein
MDKYYSLFIEEGSGLFIPRGILEAVGEGISEFVGGSRSVSRV